VRVGLAVIATALLLPAASAGTSFESGQARLLHATALTPVERKALRIVSVRTVGAESAGLMVTATFAGNIEKVLGRGHLESALVAVILRPKDPAFKPADLATIGPGPIGQTLAKTRSKDFGVVRDGRLIRFFIGGPGAANVGKVQVKAFAAAPVRTLARHVAAVGISPGEWEKIEQHIATDEETVDLALSKVAGLDCPSLRAVQKATDVALQTARARQTYLEDLQKYIDRELARVGKNVNAGTQFAADLAHSVLAPIGVAETLLTGKTPQQSVQSWKDLLRSLKLDRRLIEVYLGRSTQLIENLKELKGKIAGLLARCTPGETGTTPAPPTLTPIHAAFDQATFTTTYTENARGDDLTYTWSVSIPLDKPCAAGFKGNTPKPNQATWYHADKSQKLDGPCNHDASHLGPRGHPGTVTVVVSNLLWKCKATYEGTEGDNGNPEGDGPEPPGPGSCERKG
jgi:hypothetical protein